MRSLLPPLTLALARDLDPDAGGRAVAAERIAELVED